ncbi:Uncharacterised protein [uncultured Blautia sp.]|nr:Uncharacterised protein [uncultured Blautia sp.]
MMSEAFDTKTQQNARGKVRATSIFLFRERRLTKTAERTPGVGRLDREMAPVKIILYHKLSKKGRGTPQKNSASLLLF